jgi:hypothetical protein
MNRLWAHAAVVMLAASASFLAACSDEKPAAPKPAAPPAKKEEPAPEFDPALKTALDADMEAARGFVTQARALKEQGLGKERSGPMGSGKADFSSAATLYTQANNKMAKWCEPTAKEVVLTAEQRAYYVSKLAAERQGWVQEAATLVPLLQR